MDEWTWLQYCSQVLSMTYADPGFLSNMWFSDECHIHLNGYINRQTTRFLGFERPDVVIQKPLHSAQVMIWCTVSIHGILGPYFVEDVAQNPLTVNQEHYREIIIAPFVRDLKCFCRARNLPLWWQWMQQDGATAHTVWKSLACLQQHFGDRLISHGRNSRSLHTPRISWPHGAFSRIHFPKYSRITREDTVIFCVLGTTCVHQHVQQSKGPLWTMCAKWGYTFWIHAVPMHLDMYCINYCML